MAMKNSAKRVCAGYYTYRGYDIVEEGGEWWITESADDSKPFNRSDFDPKEKLRWAKEAVDVFLSGSN
jgi:hypothetical protein